MNFQPFGVLVQALRNTSLRLRGWPLISASIAARPVTSAMSPARRTLRSLQAALLYFVFPEPREASHVALVSVSPGGGGIEKFVVKHRLERVKIAAAHRRIALILEGEDFLVVAHRQIFLTFCASLPGAFPHSITSSARASNCGDDRPAALDSTLDQLAKD